MYITIKTKRRRNTAVSKCEKDEADTHKHTSQPVDYCELLAYTSHRWCPRGSLRNKQNKYASRSMIVIRLHTNSTSCDYQKRENELAALHRMCGVKIKDNSCKDLRQRLGI